MYLVVAQPVRGWCCVARPSIWLLLFLGSTVVCISTCLHIYACTYVCKHVSMYVCTHIRTYVRMCIQYWYCIQRIFINPPHLVQAKFSQNNDMVDYTDLLQDVSYVCTICCAICMFRFFEKRSTYVWVFLTCRWIPLSVIKNYYFCFIVKSILEHFTTILL